MSDVVDNSAPVADTGIEEAVDSQVEQQTDEQGEQKVVAPKNIRKIKYKADGQDYEDEIDLDDDKQLAKHLSMSKAAYKRMEEASKTRSQAEQFIKMLQADPVKILTHEQFGGATKFRELAMNYLAKEIEAEMLTPEERQRKANEDRLRQYEDKEKEAKTKIEAEQMTKLEEHYAQDFQTKIVKGLSSQGIPKTARTVKRMAELMSKNLQHNLELEPEQLAEIVRQDYIAEMKEMFGAAEGDILLKLLGDDVANKIRKTDLARLRSGGMRKISG